MPRRIDDTKFGTVRILQDSDGFCYGIDAVLLAGFIQECIGKRNVANRSLCDLGTGTGIIPLILSHKTEIGRLVGLEYQEASYGMALENIPLNNLSGRLEFQLGNVCDIDALAQNMGGKRSFDFVSSNPPYTAKSHGMTSEATAKQIARHEIVGSLDDFVRAASVLLKDRGEFYLVHRPNRMVDIFEACRRWKLEPKRLCLVSGHKGEAPNILLLQAVKNGGVELTVDPILYVREKDGSLTQKIKEIYEK